MIYNRSHYDFFFFIELDRFYIHSIVMNNLSRRILNKIPPKKKKKIPNFYQNL